MVLARLMESSNLSLVCIGCLMGGGLHKGPGPQRTQLVPAYAPVPRYSCSDTCPSSHTLKLVDLVPPLVPRGEGLPPSPSFEGLLLCWNLGVKFLACESVCRPLRRSTSASINPSSFLDTIPACFYSQMSWGWGPSLFRGTSQLRYPSYFLAATGGCGACQFCISAPPSY